MFIVFVVVVGSGCLLALGFGVAALSVDRRAVALARYPLRMVSWTIAAPFFVLSGFGALVGLSLASDGSDSWVWVAGLLCVAAAVACVVAIVMCSRAAKGKYARGPWAPAVLGFGAPLVPMVLGPANWSGDYLTILGLLVVAGAGVNGLLAVRVNQSVRFAEPSAAE